MARRALILGASGLVGGHLLKRLLELDHYGSVVAITRHPLALTHDKLVNPVTDFGDLEAVMADYPVADIHCCLGTTIKQAKSRRRFERVDFNYPLAAARRGRLLGAEHLLLVSSIGANPLSLSFYLRTKGRVECAIGDLGYPHLSIFRPSLLTGRREQMRTGEVIAEKFLNALGPLAGSQRPIAAQTVAEAMAAVALQPAAGRGIYLPRQIRRLAEQFLPNVH